MANLPDLEVVSAQVHDSWMLSKRAQNVTSRLSEAGEELMVPYDQLSEAAKDLDRNTVKAVFAAIAAVPRIEPEEVTVEDFYAAHAIGGILAAGGYPSQADSLAEAAFDVVKAMARQRTKYFTAATAAKQE